MPLSPLRQHLVVNKQLEIAVVLSGREVEALAVVHEFAAFYFPMRVDVVGARLALRIGAALDGVLLVFRLRLRWQREQVLRIARAPAVPAGDLLAVEERGEARGRFVIRAKGEAGERGEEEWEGCFFHGVVGKKGMRCDNSHTR